MKRIVVLDIGGGGGIHRSWNHFPSDLTYYSFDPNPDQADDLLAQSKEVSGKSKNKYVIVNKAVTGKSETRRVNIFDNRFAGSLYQHTVGGCYRFEKMKLLSQLEVDCIGVDVFCQAEKIRPDFLSIDAEGSTFDVLSGAKKAVEDSVLGIRVELELSHLYEHSPKFYKSIQLLDEAGYRCTRMETCNSGFFGATTDMNRYSVSPSDGMPLTTDAVFINTALIMRLIDGAMGEEDLFKVANAILFCIHNSCGFYGMDLLVALKKKHSLEALANVGDNAQVLDALFRVIAMYFSLQRRNINRDFNADEEFIQLTGRKLQEFDALEADAAAKIKNLYDEDDLYKKWVEPSGQSDTAQFN